MQKKKTAVSLVAKVIAGLTFVSVFVLNVVMLVQADSKGLSMESLKAYAQTGGTNNEEGHAAYDDYSVTNTTAVWECISGYVNGKPVIGHYTETCTAKSCYGTGSVSCTTQPLICTNGPCL